MLPAAAVVLALQLAWHPERSSGRPPASAPRSSSSSSRSPIRAGWAWATSKLALLLGVGVGRAVPVALFVGMLAALVPSIVLLARHGAAARKMKIPFAPFLALGGVVALFAGNPLLDWYLRFL